MSQKVLEISLISAKVGETQRNIRHGPYLQEISILFEKIPDLCLGRNEAGLYEQCVKIQTITSWSHLANNTQL